MPSAMQREKKQKKLTKKPSRAKTHWMKSCKAAFRGYFPSNCGSFLRGVAAARGGEERRKLKGILRFPPSLRVCSYFLFHSLFFVHVGSSMYLSESHKKATKKRQASKCTPRHLRESRSFPLAGRVSRWEGPHDQGHHKAGKEKDS